MVLAFVALVALANGMLAGVGGWFGQDNWSFQGAVGWLFAPVMFLIGIPWGESGVAGGLFGTKIVLNEFVAFIDLASRGPAAARPNGPGDHHLCVVRVRPFTRAHPLAGSATSPPPRP